MDQVSEMQISAGSQVCMNKDHYAYHAHVSMMCVLLFLKACFAYWPGCDCEYFNDNNADHWHHVRLTCCPFFLHHRCIITMFGTKLWQDLRWIVAQASGPPRDSYMSEAM